MTNFIFKSPGTFKKISNNLEVILNEQRHQRQDLATILYLIKQHLNNVNLQKTVDDFYRSGESVTPNGDSEDSN